MKHPHQLYRDGDQFIPQAILDRNGQVVLDLCKLCGRAEVELDYPCCGNCKHRMSDDFAPLWCLKFGMAARVQRTVGTCGEMGLGWELDSQDDPAPIIDHQ